MYFQLSKRSEIAFYCLSKHTQHAAMDVAHMLEELVSANNQSDYFGKQIQGQLKEGVEPKAVVVKGGVSGYTLMHYACERGWSGLAKALVEEHSCDPNAVTENGLTPLHYACRYDRIDATRFLVLDVHCNVNCCDKEQQTPLHYYYRWNKKYSDIVKLLVDAKVDVDKREVFGYTVLMMACSSRDAETTRYLISEAHCDVTLSSNDGYTALHLVSLLLLTDEIPKILLHSTNIDVNAKNNDGDTPLHLACKAENLGRIQLLVRDERCTSHEKNNDGDTALHVACCRFQFNLDEILKVLLEEAKIDPTLRNNDGNTPLHLACKNQYFEVVQILFKLFDTATVNLNAKNNDGKTPLDLATDINIIKELIRQGADPQNVYKNHGKVLGKHSPKQPPQTPVQIFIVGNSSAGKSTLAKGLQSEVSRFVSLLTRSKRVSGVDTNTVGIIPHDFQSKTYGRITLYDFAGHREFYVGHIAPLQNSIKNSAPIFLVVVDVSQSDEDIKQSIFYWLSFLDNQCTSVSSKPHIIVIGSHADMLKSRGEDLNHKASFITSLLTTPQFSNLEFTGFVAMDCRYADSAGMRELHQALKTSCDSLRIQENVNFIAHCFLVYLLDNFKETSALKIGQIFERISHNFSHTAAEITGFLPRNVEECIEVCNELNDRGHLLMIKSDSDVENSSIIIDTFPLLEAVHGTIFAPDGLKERTKLASSTGVVPLGNIAQHFPGYDLTVLVNTLTHFQIWHEISDSEILELINHKQASTSSEAASPQEERYFFFPGLVTLEVPSTVWEPQPQFEYHCGWILQCSRPEEFFSARFLQILLLRLAFSFTLSKLPSTHCPSLQRKCSIWKSGICWVDSYGVETLVEVSEQNRVVVLMRCPEIKSECLQLRSLLIQKVLAAAREFCREVNTVESFINPSDSIQYPLKPTTGCGAQTEQLCKPTVT